MDDGLAVTVSFDARYGASIDRALVLGGGGLYFIAWQAAYLAQLQRLGLPLASADRVVGTSAGSVVASSLVGGHLRRLDSEVDLLAKVPALMASMAPAADLRPSQQRALDLFNQADNARPETVIEIGRAALAARAAKAERMRSSITLLLKTRTWPGGTLRITATDTFSGERVVITEQAQVGIATAAAASSAVPGLFEPQQVGDRRCMDGGVSGTGTHADLVAGARRVLIVALSAHMDNGLSGMTLGPGAVAAEHAALEAAGSAYVVVGPESVDIATLMDPVQVSAARRAGIVAAERDAAALLDFWS